MLIVSYLLLLQFTELLSIMIPAILFLFLRYVLHVPIHQMKQFLKNYALPKIIMILLLCESSAFLVVYPLLIQVFTPLASHPFMLSYSILLLQVLPWIFKCKKLYEIVIDKKEDQKDHAIYQ